MNASFLAPIKHKKFIVTNWRFTNVVPKKILHKIILFLNPFIKAKSIYVPQEDIQTYFNACDLVFIPRIDSMNSGILFLALGFGKVVIGPSVGNVQDVLKLTGNPIYIPNDKKSIISAFKQGYNLSKGSKQGEKNKAFAEKELSDEVIIKEYIDLYTELISKKINND
ncbi:MAG: glycosyltransferase [bacterium]